MTPYLFLALFIAASAIVYERPEGLSHEDAFAQYNSFWNKTHGTTLEAHNRLENFKYNTRKIAEMNAASKSQYGARFGYTQFSDMSPSEFKQKMLGFKPAHPLNTEVKKRTTEQGPSGAIDWVAKGMTTPVKDQGQCGSCWAFSTAETVESANLVAGNQVPNASPQEIVDCDSADQGCNGGDPQEALQWVVSQGGLMTDSCYPYTAQDGSCNPNGCSANAQLNIKNVIPVAQDEGQIYTALQSYPLSICCDAEPWQNYQGGILTADQCGTSVDHAIQLTGYSPNQGGYWIVRNSWSASWGINGFIWLQYGQNTCAITSEVTGATVN